MLALRDRWCPRATARSTWRLCYGASIRVTAVLWRVHPRDVSALARPSTWRKCSGASIHATSVLWCVHPRDVSALVRLVSLLHVLLCSVTNLALARDDTGRFMQRVCCHVTSAGNPWTTSTQDTWIYRDTSFFIRQAQIKPSARVETCWVLAKRVSTCK